MIRPWLVILLLVLGGPALAGAVRVTSGEHDGFTRLVFEYGKPVDWSLGRNADGYQLRLSDEVPSYDLTAAFKLIGKSRLAAIWAAPDTGDISIGLACACHAIPFEFRPGIVVIDLKDGPPPAGSAFETALDGTLVAPITPSPTARPRARPADDGQISTEPGAGAYDWTEAAYEKLRPTAMQDELGTVAEPTAASTLLPPDLGLQPLRDDILQQMARGASQGVVQMTSPSPRSDDRTQDAFPSAQIRIGDAPTSVTRSVRSVNPELGADGTACIAQTALNIAEWGDDTLPIVDQMAILRNNLSGEFDKPDPIAVEQAAKFHLFLGFGAEARQLMSAFDLQNKETGIWRAISHIIDDQSDPEGIFRDQTACGGPAALWSALADDSVAEGKPIDTGAIRLAFSALPVHLRRLLGPGLAEKFLAIGDEDTARALSAAITRAPGDAGDKVSLIEAGIDLHAGNAEKSERIAEEVLSDPGPDQPEALIALTKARIAQKLPVTAEVALALQAHLSDHLGTSLEKPLNEALILAQAASGNFEAAFSGLQSFSEPEPEVWSLLVHLAPDAAFLALAVPDPAIALPNIPDETATEIARRLAGFGLGAPATAWLATVESPDPLLLAQTALKNGDGRAALRPLALSEGELAQELKLQAFALIGENVQQAELLKEAGDLVAASAALARAGEWAELAETGDEPWKSVATRLSQTEPPAQEAPASAYGPLARGHDLAQAGEATRTAISLLLKATPTPTAQTISDKTAAP